MKTNVGVSNSFQQLGSSQQMENVKEKHEGHSWDNAFYKIISAPSSVIM